jgi:hypothetical protein
MKVDVDYVDDEEWMEVRICVIYTKELSRLIRIQ